MPLEDAVQLVELPQVEALGLEDLDVAIRQLERADAAVDFKLAVLRVDDYDSPVMARQSGFILARRDRAPSRGATCPRPRGRSGR